MLNNCSPRAKRTLLSIAFILLSLPPQSAFPDTCNTLTFTGNAEYPPILWRDRDNPDRLTGVAAEILEKALKTANISVVTQDSGPWSRAQQNARKGEVDGIAGAFFTEERTAYLDYIFPPFMNIPNVLFVRADSTLDFTNREQLKTLRGVTLINNSFGQRFDTYASNHLKISTVHSVTLAFKMLLVGRSDYLIYELQPGLAYSDALGISKDIKHLAQKVNSEDLHYALSKKSPCNTAELRAQLEHYLHTEVTPAHIEKLTTKYRKLWQEQASRPTNSSN